jgi:hypothetical protein
MNPRNFFAELKRRDVYDPTLASLHDDPRFAMLVKKMGFLE